jgi:hypothetical protein
MRAINKRTVTSVLRIVNVDLQANFLTCHRVPSRAAWASSDTCHILLCTSYELSTFGTHHILCCHGLRSFSASRRPMVSAAERIMCRQADHRVGQQIERPARPSCGRRRTGRGNEQGFLLLGELAAATGTVCLVQCRCQTLLHETPFGAINCRGTGTHRFGNGVLACPWSAASRICARLTSRTCDRPLPSISSNAMRSSSLSVTRYRTFIVYSPLHQNAD